MPPANQRSTVPHQGPGDVATAVDGIRRVVRALRLAEQRTRAETGLSAAQLYVLAHLDAAPAASISELGDRTLTDRSSVAAVVERLEERGLVQRRVSGVDRRRATVSITRAGHALLRRAPRAPTALLVEALGALEPAELGSLARGLTRLTEQLGVSAEPAGMLFEDDPPPPARARRGRPRATRRGG